MSLIHDPEVTDKSVLVACAAALRELDRRLFMLSQHRVQRGDEFDLCFARGRLHGIIQSNGYEVEYPSYRLRSVR